MFFSLNCVTSRKLLTEIIKEEKRNVKPFLRKQISSVLNEDKEIKKRKIMAFAKKWKVSWDLFSLTFDQLFAVIICRDYLLGLFAGIICWDYLLGLFAWIICWDYLLGSFAGIISWDYLLGLFAGIIYWDHF